jgi:uncharacterized SAM-binding protein YcdF (DUF218 family)
VFVLLSKLLDLLLEPLVWGLGLVVTGLLVRARRPRLGVALPALGAAALLVFSLPPVSTGLVRALEAGAEETFRPTPPYDAIVVLGGAVDSAASAATGAVELTAAADRLVRAATVLRAGHAREVLLSGGVVFPDSGGVPDAEAGRRVLLDAGVAPERIVVELASRNTRENAVEAARIAGERGWTRLLLVTSAAHMPRALGCFRAVGLAPDALPVDHRAARGGGPWVPRASALDASTDALREWTGRLVYRALGYAR